MLAAHRMDGRDIIEGVLGCPVCHAEFSISEGVAHFAGVTPNAAASITPSEEEALRLVALLDLTCARGYAVIVGELGAHAPHMRELTDVQLLLVNPPARMRMGSGVSDLTIEPPWSTLPLAAASARGVALDDLTTQSQLEAAVAVVAAGGRVLAPTGLEPPDGLTELARDDRHWVAERRETPRTSAIVSLQRKR